MVVLLEHSCRRLFNPWMCTPYTHLHVLACGLCLWDGLSIETAQSKKYNSWSCGQTEHSLIRDAE